MRAVIRTILLLAMGAALGIVALLAWSQVPPRPVAVGAAPGSAQPAPVAQATATSAPSTSAAPAAQATAVTQAQSPVITAAAENVVASVYEQVSPSVVRIVVRERSSSGRTARGEGSGVVLDRDGYILTNNHVVESATFIQVEFPDGYVAEAQLIGRDPATDAAVIKVDPADVDLKPARLGDSDKVRPGEVAIAIGSPFSFSQTVTAGVISGVGRVRQGVTARPIRRMIQTDAPLNPGNSGGPLLNARGEVVGINTMILPRSATMASLNQDSIPEGIGFAVPINTVKRLLPRLMKGETIEHAWLGITGQPIDRQIARELRLPVEKGVLVTSVVQRGPASNAGIRGGNRANNAFGINEGGDIILSINGVEMRTVDDVAEYVDTQAVGDTVKVEVLRNGQRETIAVTLGAWPAQLNNQ